jgi:hypothetical protein
MRSYLRFMSFSMLVVCLIATTSCVKNRRWQVSTQPITPAVVPLNAATSVAVIEFDGMGQLWDRCSLDPATDPKPCQLRNAIDYIHRQRKTAHGAQEDPIVVTFVHGWRHNAETKDENFRAFSTMLTTLQRNSDDRLLKCQQAAVTSSPACTERRSRFIGVYIGWRGEVVRFPLDFFTVFDREMGAKRTALVSMSEVFVQLRNAAKQTSADDPSLPSERARFLLFGHSYGGLIVERVIAQMFASSLLIEHKSDRIPCDSGGSGVRPFADLVVLINPATDSVGTTQFIDLMKRSKVTVCSPVHLAEGLSAPLIIAIHARNDSATGKVFATGHTIESVNKAFRTPEKKSTPPEKRCDFCDDGVGKPPSESFLYRHTPGHAIYLANLCYVDEAPETGDWVCDRVRQTVNAAIVAAGGDSSKSVYKNAPPQQMLPPQLTQRLQSLLALPAAASSPSGGTLVLNLFYRHLPLGEHDEHGHSRPWNNTPYWIFTVPKNVVDKHSGFWNKDFTDLMTSLVAATTPPGGTPII